ncbi:MAG: DUF4176 domain-containing protein [Bacilli bacterium]
MKDKYLPIGSIVSIKGINKNIMITGYYALKYQNVVKMFDYEGISYPEGVLLDNKYVFNHSEITNVLFEGYKDDAYNVLNNNLIGQNNQNSDNFSKKDNFLNIKYDENGVVNYQEYESEKSVSDLVELLNETEVMNPFDQPTAHEETKSAIPVVENETNNNISAAALEDTKSIEDSLNAVLEENRNNDDMETMNIDIPTYKFTEDGIIINE